MIWPDPYCASCGRQEPLSDYAVPRWALSTHASPREPAAAMRRLNLCIHCGRALGVLPLSPARAA